MKPETIVVLGIITALLITIVLTLKDIQHLQKVATCHELNIDSESMWNCINES